MKLKIRRSRAIFENQYEFVKGYKYLSNEKAENCSNGKCLFSFLPFTNLPIRLGVSNQEQKRWGRYRLYSDASHLKHLKSLHPIFDFFSFLCRKTCTPGELSSMCFISLITIMKNWRKKLRVFFCSFHCHMLWKAKKRVYLNPFRFVS